MLNKLDRLKLDRLKQWLAVSAPLLKKYD